MQLSMKAVALGILFTASTLQPLQASTPPQPKTLTETIKNYQGVSYWSWKQAADKIAISQPALGTITTEVGKRTVPDTKQTMRVITQVSKLFTNFEQPKSVTIAYVSFIDNAWGKALIEKFCGSDCGYDISGEAEKMCKSAQECFGAFAVKNQRTKEALIYQTASDAGKRQSSRVTGTIEAHEYTHTIQDIAVGNTSYETVPRWLVEGGANWVQAVAVFSGSQKKYLEERKRVAKELFGSKMYTAAFLEEFLNPKSGFGWKSWDNYEFWRIYDIGMLATEIMTAVKGPDSFMNMHLRMGQGESFETAFEAEFNMPWDKGAKVLARSIQVQLQKSK